jgi:hypothetical protein
MLERNRLDGVQDRKVDLAIKQRAMCGCGVARKNLKVQSG